MPQRPALRHVLGKIRLGCGLSQKELAKLLGVSAITVQKIEQGKLGLSEELAQKAQTELDVSAGWLLANDPKSLPVTPRGGKWTKDLYEFAQGGRDIVSETTEPVTKHSRSRVRASITSLIRVNPNIPAEDTADEFTAWQIAAHQAKVDAKLEGSKGTRRQGILLHRFKQFFAKLDEEFPDDQKKLAEHASKVARLKRAFDRKAKQIGQEETERLWSDPVTRPKA